MKRFYKIFLIIFYSLLLSFVTKDEGGFLDSKLGGAFKVYNNCFLNINENYFTQSNFIRDCHHVELINEEIILNRRRSEDLSNIFLEFLHPSIESSLYIFILGINEVKSLISEYLFHYLSFYYGILYRYYLF